MVSLPSHRTFVGISLVVFTALQAGPIVNQFVRACAKPSPLTFAPCQLGKHLSTILLVLLNLPLDVDKSNKATEAT